MPNACWPPHAQANSRSPIKNSPNRIFPIPMKTGREQTRRTQNAERKTVNGKRRIFPYKKYLSFFVACSLFSILRSPHLEAADFQVSASLDRPQIALNEQAVLSLTISGNATDLPQPELPGLTNFQVSNAGKSQNFSWINGQASASITYSYVLTPLQEGHFTIPPIRVQYQGQTAESPTLSLDVVKGEAGAIPAVRSQPGARPAGGSGAAAL